MMKRSLLHRYAPDPSPNLYSRRCALVELVGVYSAPPAPRCSPCSSTPPQPCSDPVVSIPPPSNSSPWRASIRASRVISLRQRSLNETPPVPSRTESRLARETLGLVPASTDQLGSLRPPVRPIEDRRCVWWFCHSSRRGGGGVRENPVLKSDDAALKRTDDGWGRILLAACSGSSDVHVHTRSEQVKNSMLLLRLFAPHRKSGYVIPGGRVAPVEACLLISFFAEGSHVLGDAADVGERIARVSRRFCCFHHTTGRC